MGKIYLTFFGGWIRMGKKANQEGNAIWAKSNEAGRGGGGRITSRAGR